MFGGPDHLPTHLSPVYAFIKGFINQTDNTDVVASDDVQTKGHLLAGLIILNGADHSLDGAFKNLELVLVSEQVYEHFEWQMAPGKWAGRGNVPSLSDDRRRKDCPQGCVHRL